VTIRLDNVPEVWVTNVQIAYDPTLIYVMGTKAGSPVQQGDLFGADSSIVARNFVQDGALIYTLSMIAPADPTSGSGAIGTFQIVPLAAGTTQLRFAQAELTTLSFTGEGENRVGTDPRPVEFQAALLEVTITGETVEPPSEATATPTVTETPLQSAAQPQGATPLATLENITLAPTTPAAQTPLVTIEPPEVEDESDDSSSALMIAVAALVVVGLILVVMFAAWRRSRT
ncbi:MAG: hypothetical protein K8I82_21855, partial [Anaerolineae bacterium]|nr:hypothetical protein [Anaerolineae bacterium]